MALLSYLFMVYLLFEITFIAATRTSLVEKVIIWHNVKKWIRYNLPDDWNYKIGFVSINRDVVSKSIEVYVEVWTNKPINSYSNWTNDWVKTKKYKVYKSDLIERIRQMDPSFDIRQHQRNIKLNKLI